MCLHLLLLHGHILMPMIIGSIPVFVCFPPLDTDFPLVKFHMKKKGFVKKWRISKIAPIKTVVNPVFGQLKRPLFEIELSSCGLNELQDVLHVYNVIYIHVDIYIYTHMCVCCPDFPGRYRCFPESVIVLLSPISI